eukprot:TRINITY_DN3490_c0_g1_i8.p1 TRINITY_DN3490_c0_g1~~TRINITY_DN3490_c0_g1_i8.p1  ORF type:complete len:241 (-),score=-20.99 TRINITY_DN3490_c0_g1_i8:39-761(-)
MAVYFSRRCQSLFLMLFQPIYSLFQLSTRPAFQTRLCSINLNNLVFSWHFYIYRLQFFFQFCKGENNHNLQTQNQGKINRKQRIYNLNYFIYEPLHLYIYRSINSYIITRNKTNRLLPYQSFEFVIKINMYINYIYQFCYFPNQKRVYRNVKAYSKVQIVSLLLLRRKLNIPPLPDDASASFYSLTSAYLYIYSSTVYNYAKDGRYSGQCFQHAYKSSVSCQGCQAQTTLPGQPNSKQVP